MKRLFMFFALSICLYTTGSAQYRHEFSVNAGGGLSSLQYSPSTGNQKAGFGGTAGIGYHFFFSPQWGLGTGVNIAFYNATATLASFSGSSDAVTAGGDQFTFNYAYTNYEEKPTATMFTIPLMLQYQGVGKTSFYAAVGGKIGFPVNATYKTAGSLTITGYFADIDVHVDPNLPDYGFYTYDVNQKTDMDLKTAFMISAEAGAKWRLGKTGNLYTGVYIDYGLNDVKSSKSNALIAYQPSTPGAFMYGSLATASDKVCPLAIGATLRLSFGAGRSTSKASKQQTFKNSAIEENTSQRKIAATQEVAVQTIDIQAEQEQEQAAARRQQEIEAQQRIDKETAIAAAEKARQDTIRADMERLLKTVENFPENQADLDSIQRQKMKAKVEVLKRYSYIRIIIEGYTCNSKSEGVSNQVGQARADAAKAFLVNEGIDPKRISTVSWGMRYPLAPNTSEANKRINRRVEFRIDLK